MGSRLGIKVGWRNDIQRCHAEPGIWIALRGVLRDVSDYGKVVYPVFALLVITGRPKSVSRVIGNIVDERKMMINAIAGAFVPSASAIICRSHLIRVIRAVRRSLESLNSPIAFLFDVEPKAIHA